MPFNLRVRIEASSDKVFDAIANSIQDWWGITKGESNKPGGEFYTTFKPTKWTFRVDVFEENRLIVWDCIEAYHVHSGYEGIEKEWLGSKISWELEEVGNSTQLRFSHDGLEPNLNCYEICTPAWEMFVTQSLKAFVESGKGMPAYFE